MQILLKCLNLVMERLVLNSELNPWLGCQPLSQLMLGSGCSLRWKEITCGSDGLQVLKVRAEGMSLSIFLLLHAAWFIVTLFTWKSNSLSKLYYMVWASLTSIILGAGCAKLSKSTKSLLNVCLIHCHGFSPWVLIMSLQKHCCHISL